MWIYERICKWIKESKSNVEISAKWINKNYTQNQLTIITSEPIENLNQPIGYYENSLGKTVFPESYKEFNENQNGDFLNYSVSENISNEFVNALREFNSNVEISMNYDSEEKVGIIVSSIPLKDLKFPTGHYGGIGLDRDGKIAYLKDEIIDYKINYELDGFDNSDQYTEITQRYFEGVSRKKEHEKYVQESSINEFGEILRPVSNVQEVASSDIPHFEPPKNTNISEEHHLVKSNPQDELVRMANEKRKFTILQRERAMSDTQKSKNRAAIMAGVCILGAAVSVYFNGQDIDKILQHELNAIYSWEALGQYFQDLGPLTSLLSAGAGGFIAKYLKKSKKLKQVQNEFVDFNNSLENEQILGGNENVKSRWISSYG